MNRLESKLKYLGSTIIQRERHGLKPDNAYRPKRLPRGRSTMWPSLVGGSRLAG
ncbi:hypothetical protein BGW36DRAFT_373556 [Talaromyces proteolyticus]|uniref:Uncharacterized protein n=1 Tax=Talaromyces proteolyticus TaxID=1131652 RepID=A0AAD4KYI1_9EURO|nr:uncharacterized protein BGW36DRAFT_373556 [Talaromyces proteolyticus]KAH8700170.1 hypothetical protein BGW36DRAFT_373556 [Talaromyces proteolyticus]